ncbi:hypothetical protein KY285_011250 [Solanum tuberosum]|nr:hypothetical protein KY285_011250 [Solanum tuberosum]
MDGYGGDSFGYRLWDYDSHKHKKKFKGKQKQIEPVFVKPEDYENSAEQDDAHEEDKQETIEASVPPQRSIR